MYYLTVSDLVVDSDSYYSVGTACNDGFALFCFIEFRWFLRIQEWYSWPQPSARLLADKAINWINGTRMIRTQYFARVLLFEACCSYDGNRPKVARPVEHRCVSLERKYDARWRCMVSQRKQKWASVSVQHLTRDTHDGHSRECGWIILLGTLRPNHASVSVISIRVLLKSAKKASVWEGEQTTQTIGECLRLHFSAADLPPIGCWSCEHARKKKGGNHVMTA